MQGRLRQEQNIAFNYIWTFIVILVRKYQRLKNSDSSSFQNYQYSPLYLERKNNSANGIFLGNIM